MKLNWHNSAMVSAPSRLVSCSGHWRRHEFPIRYGLLEHPSRGFVLIDTGYSPDLFHSRDMHVTIYRNLLRPRLIGAGEAMVVVTALGARPSDVRHIVLTHLHADHMCGLQHFPNATLHGSAATLQGWENQHGFSSVHKGYFASLLPALSDRNVTPVENAPVVALPWGGTGHDIFGDGSVVTVDLPGHMPGHMGVFFPKVPKPVLHAADVDWTFASLLDNAALTWPARLIIDDPATLLHSKTVVQRALRCGFDITLSHDVMA
jgi:glyoxylase-like metal-dependent hydrolase (beta-lactamase superfamily II)